MEPTPLLENEIQFEHLMEVVSKYRQDVHHLNANAHPDAIVLASDRLGVSIPMGMAAFMNRWNGADLFRGALRIRAMEELTASSAELRQLILFAETNNVGEHWVFAEDGFGGHSIGLWVGGEFHPYHQSFTAWLSAQLEILDTGSIDSSQQFQIRQRYEPNSPYLIAYLAKQAELNENNTDAIDLWFQCTELAPNWPEPYLRLSQLKSNGEKEAEKALSLLQLPMPTPAFAPSAVGLFSKLNKKAPKQLMHSKLTDFCHHRVENVLNSKELNVLAKGIFSLSKLCIRHGERTKAKDYLEAFLQQKNHFDFSGETPDITLLLADIQIDLGLHDEAEKTLRPLLCNKHPYNSAANLRIGKIAVMRHEPWARDILTTRFSTPLTPEIEAQSLVLIAACDIRTESIDKAEENLRRAEELAYENQLQHVMALVKLGQGDIAKHRLKIGSAERLYQEAIDFSEDAEDEEIRCRILVRQGDLLRQVGEKEKAFANYMLAAD